MEKIYWLLFDDDQLKAELPKIKDSLSDLSFIRIESVSDLKNLRNYLYSQLPQDYFKSDLHKLAFCLINYQSKVFNDELNIKRRHFVDKKLAKSWMIEMQNKFHPDKNIKLYSDIDFTAVSGGITKAYSEMVGRK